jgi:methylthioribose-1-phosphate isomerase
MPLSSTASIINTSFIPEEFSPIRWEAGQLQLLDQRILPHQQQWLSYDNATDVANAITDMVVRGAPAIGITAAYGVVLSALHHVESLASGDATGLQQDVKTLAASRPTAINLHWALQRMSKRLTKLNQTNQNIATVIQQLQQEAIAIHQQDINFCHQIGLHGASLITPESTLYTHCNAGALATGGHGTALGVIRTAHQQQKVAQVFAGETRPWMQGARLTSWELTQANIPTQLVTEGAAGYTMKNKNVDWLIVGADRISADGSAANKIGTYNLAILAKHHGCKVMVAAPSSTFDLTIEDGQHIPIEQRPTSEITHYKDIQIAPDCVEAFNPSFDVTPPELIDAIVTERGIIEQPTASKVAQHFKG